MADAPIFLIMVSGLGLTLTVFSLSVNTVWKPLKFLIVRTQWLFLMVAIIGAAKSATMRFGENSGKGRLTTAQSRR